MKNSQVETESIWGSILSGKFKEESKTDLDPPPYVHPLVKRSAALSDKSLEICTESLGSETGSDGFSLVSGPVHLHSKKLRSSTMNRIKRLTLPPPLPSLSLKMRSRRSNGRLVVEAVSIPIKDCCFRAERQDGRLLLTLSDNLGSEQVSNDDAHDEDDDDVEEAGELAARPYIYSFNNKLQPCWRPVLIFNEPHCIVTS